MLLSCLFLFCAVFVFLSLPECATAPAAQLGSRPAGVTVAAMVVMFLRSEETRGHQSSV